MNTVVIDAGHGGKDPGAVSKDRKTYEKTLTLDIARKLAAGISSSCPDVKVVMTRTDDRFVSLDDRAAIANKADADLFISVHINSTKSTSPNGYSLHTLGQSKVKNRDLFAYNMDVCIAENSVIKLEDDYSTRYEGFNPEDPESYIFMQLMQNSHLEQSLQFSEFVHDALAGGPIWAGRGVWQNPFYVLWKTSMPAVLVELGFISNPDDLAVLRSEKKRAELSDRILKAFIRYKESYDGSYDTGDRRDRKVPQAPAKDRPEMKDKTVPVTEAKPADKPAAKETAPAPVVMPVTEKPVAAKTESDTVYGYQIFVLSKKLMPGDPAFLGFDPVIVPVGKVFKYVIGTASTSQAAKANRDKIKKKYPDAFPVFVKNGVISPLR